VSWTTLLAPEKKKSYFKDILHFLEKEYVAQKNIYPAKSDIFNALKLTEFDHVKVVILGQDPYHNPGQAHGLAFSVKFGVSPPPSLLNIFKELQSDCHITKPNHGCLEKWAKQGVLLLNSVLTVEKNKPQSHAKIGWQQFTDAVIASLNHHEKRIVFLLWGAYAKQKRALIDESKHVVLTSAHPSPLSAHAGFLGCKHFSKVNALLRASEREPIDWTL